MQQQTLKTEILDIMTSRRTVFFFVETEPGKTTLSKITQLAVFVFRKQINKSHYTYNEKEERQENVCQRMSQTSRIKVGYTRMMFDEKEAT